MRLSNTDIIEQIFCIQAYYEISCGRRKNGLTVNMHNVKKMELSHCTKIEFSIKDFFSNCNQIPSFLRIWSHLLNKSLMENFIFGAVSWHWWTNRFESKNNLQSINLLDIVTWLEGSNLIFWLEQQRFTMLR